MLGLKATDYQHGVHQMKYSTTLNHQFAEKFTARLHLHLQLQKYLKLITVGVWLQKLYLRNKNG